MKNNIELVLKKSICMGVLFLIVWSCKNEKQQTQEVPFYSKIETNYKSNLEALIAEVDLLSQQNQIEALQIQFKKARLVFKKLEPFLAFYKESVYKSLNQANLPTLHEDSNGVVEEQPQGFQVLEEVLFSESPDINQAQVLISSMKALLSLEQKSINVSFFKDYHFMWMFRKSLIRVLAMGITGFDSPIAKQSIPETEAVFVALKESLELYAYKFQSKTLYEQWIKQLSEAIEMLQEDTNFDAFNRYAFTRNHLEPLLPLWKQTVKDWNVEFPFATKINDDATSFFSANTFNSYGNKINKNPKIQEDISALGYDLFLDKRLSSNNKMNCATCHIQDKYFTDGLPKAIGNDGKALLRNTPTLYYASLQANQFYDGRVRSLENQVNAVAENEKEFHLNLASIVPQIEADSLYSTKFKTLYKDGVSEKNIKNAIANYMRSLNPFNSKFDRNISGLDNDLSVSEIKGFNLFMGKAQCATCHFAPIFNGTVPPNFTHSEFEVLGVPEQAVFKNAKVDTDLGRYDLFGADKRKFAFKTSTVRNVGKTAPYMHNGVFNTLNEVVEFYNLGGGHGIGIELDNQTLPPDQLNLSDEEIENLVAFMESLTDKTKAY